MIVALMKAGAIMGVVTMAMTKPAMFISYMHNIVLIMCTSLILLYVGGFKQGIRFVSITLVGYVILQAFMGVNNPTDVTRKGEYIPPVEAKIAVEFGENTSYKGGVNKGIDFDVPEGTKVKSSKAGAVCFAGYSGNIDGNMVRIDHPDGTQTMYAHNSRVLVTVGQSVDQGEVIALSGNTGRSKGPHVHFEISLDGGRTTIDPAPHLNLKQGGNNQ